VILNVEIHEIFCVSVKSLKLGKEKDRYLMFNGGGKSKGILVVDKVKGFTLHPCCTFLHPPV
jgi:hypothetical protein